MQTIAMPSIEMPQQIPLKFLLGEFTLFSHHWSLHVEKRHFTEYTDRLGNDALPDFAIPAGADGVLISSRPIREPLSRLRSGDGVICYVPSQYQRFYIDMSAGMDGYREKFSAKSRSTIKRKVKKFAEFSGGEIDWKVYGSPAEMAEFHRLARDVSRHTYQETLLDAGLPDGERFLGELQVMAAADRVRGFLLFHEHKPIAYLYCPIQGDVVIYSHLGYREEFARHSPGTVLFWLALEHLFAEQRYSLFDFTEGGSEANPNSHKRFFGTGSQGCADLFLLRDTLRNRLLVQLHSGLDSLSSTIVRLLERTGAKSAVKKFIRSLSVQARGEPS